MWLDSLRKLICKVKPELPPPTSTGEISSGDLRAVLRGFTPTEGELYLSDRTYKLCNIADIKWFLSQDRTERYKYETEFFDCDNFAYRLMGQFSVPEWSALAFGICWTDKHALNCFVDVAGKLWFIEPQQDTIQGKLATWQGSRIRFIMM